MVGRTGFLKAMKRRRERRIAINRRVLRRLKKISQ